MEELRQALEDLIAESDADEEEVTEASEVLVELLQVEGRARRIVARRAGGPSPTAREGGGSLADLTLHEAARRALDDAGFPMHVRDLATRIKARGWRHPRARTSPFDHLVRQLSARLPRHPEFTRVRPNTFALKAWGSDLGGRTRPRPRFGLFEGDGFPWARWIGEHPDAVFEDEDAR
jgi:HB1/ASXL restriction endonuclease-like protein with HTH domain